MKTQRQIHQHKLKNLKKPERKQLNQAALKSAKGGGCFINQQTEAIDRFKKGAIWALSNFRPDLFNDPLTPSEINNRLSV